MKQTFARSIVSFALALLIALSLISLVLAASNFVENFTASTSTSFNTTGTVTMNYTDAGATDGKAARLTLPAGVAAGPGNGPHLISTESNFSYGTYEARLKTADCTDDPNAGVINGGLFTYFNNGSDQTGDGLADNSEIDFEWLCAQPEVVYVTAWTDYQPSTEAHKKVWRAINIKTGQIIAACYDEVWGECQPLSASESIPSSITPIPDYSPHTQYYDYGFTWAADRITWWIINPANGQKIILWDYQGPSSRIPHRDSELMINLWHHANWTPLDCCANATNSPSSAKYLYVDWVKYIAAGSPTPTNTPVPPTNTSVPSGNLALNCPATASTNESSSLTPDKAVDGSTSTRWASQEPAPNDEWLYVDLGSSYNINQVVLNWEAAYAQSYQVQVSNNASTWTTIYSTTSGNGGVDTLNVSGSGRYVRVYMTQRGTAWGYSLWEVEVYSGGPAPTATNTPIGPTNTPQPTATSPSGWTLVWSDEFNGSSVNMNNWSYVVNGEGGGNNELQYYINGQNASIISDSEAEDGKSLVIEAREENPNNYQCWYGTCDYTSARMVTEGKQEFHYGRIMARMKLPYGTGMWPAFWMLGGSADNWPTVGEIDIMELVGGDGCSDCADDKASGDMWYGSGNGSNIGEVMYPSLPSGEIFADNYHIFGIEWDSQQVCWLFDSTTPFHCQSITASQFSAFRNNDFHILLNIAVGGDWPGPPDSSTVFPQRLYVDWVRVYQEQ